MPMKSKPAKPIELATTAKSHNMKTLHLIGAPAMRIRPLLLYTGILCLPSLGVCQRLNPAQEMRAKLVKARPLPLDAVRLLPGPLKTAQDLDADYLLDLQPDRMLAFLRQRAGLEPKAKPYGGWDGEGRQLTGHIAGHYLSAVSLMWAATDDPRFKARADYIVSELKIVQDKHGDGYLSALARGREAFGELAK